MKDPDVVKLNELLDTQLDVSRHHVEQQILAWMGGRRHSTAV